MLKRKFSEAEVLEKQKRFTVKCAEKELWRVLRHRSMRFTFVRHKSVGGLKLEYYCAALHLNVEIDYSLMGIPRPHGPERDVALAELGVHTLSVHVGQVLDPSFNLTHWINRACEARVSQELGL